MDGVKTEVQGKVVILLNGARKEKKTGKAIDIQAPEKLVEAARRDPDAVAFGYMSRQGRWVSAA
ncbi:MAG: hypothetical protein ABL908_03580 [Hyphomicrobium sp.]